MKILCKTKKGTVGEIILYSIDSPVVSVLFPSDQYSYTVPKEDIVETEVILNG